MHPRQTLQPVFAAKPPDSTADRSRWATRFRRTAAALALVVLAAGAVRFVVYQINALAFPYPLDYGEGAILDQVVRLASGANIYRTDYQSPPYVAAMYTPGYLLAQVPFERLFGPAYWYGRLISGASALAVAAFVALTIRRLTHDRTAALVGGLGVLLVPPVFAWSALMRVDLLGLALSWGGLYVLVRSQPTRTTVAASALLFAGAIFTRQTFLLAAPLAAVAFLGGSRRYAALLVGVLASVCAALLLLLTLATQGGFFFNTLSLNSNQSFLIEQAWLYARDIPRLMPVFLLMSVGYVISGLRARPPAVRLGAAYLIGGAAVVAAAGKLGAASNYQLESYTAICLAAGLMIARLRPDSPARHLLLVLIAVQGIVLLVWPGRSSIDYLISTRRISQRAEIEQVLQLVRETEGDVLADDFSGLLPLVPRRVYIEPFMFAEQARAGAWNQQPLLDDIARQEFPLILLYYGGGELVIGQRWTAEMLAQIQTSYTFDGMLADTLIWRPRQPASGLEPAPLPDIFGQ